MAVLAQLLVTLALVGHPATTIPPGVRTIEIRVSARVVHVTNRARVRRISAGPTHCLRLGAASTTAR